MGTISVPNLPMTTPNEEMHVSIHQRFRHAVFGYIREHEKSASINVGPLIKHVCLNFYLLEEEWTSVWRTYPVYWFYPPSQKPPSDDWSNRTEFTKHQIIGIKLWTQESILAQICWLTKDSSGVVNKLFLKYNDNLQSLPYSWVDVPNENIMPPHLIEVPHLDSISGSLPVGVYDESVAEYRWHFEMLEFKPFVIGLCHQGSILDYAVDTSFEQYCDRRLRVKWGREIGSFDVVFDVKKQTMRLDDDTGHSRVFDRESKLSRNSKYFLMIHFRSFADGRRCRALSTDREFTMDHSNEIVKFKGLSIKHNQHPDDIPIEPIELIANVRDASTNICQRLFELMDVSPYVKYLFPMLYSTIE